MLGAILRSEKDRDVQFSQFTFEFLKFQRVHALTVFQVAKVTLFLVVICAGVFLGGLTVV